MNLIKAFLIVIVITTANPLTEYQALEKKYVNILRSYENYTQKLKKLINNQKKLEKEISILNEEQQKLSIEIARLSNLDPGEENIPVLMAMLSPDIQEKFLLEKEIQYEIRLRIEKLYKIKKTLERKKQEQQREIKNIQTLRQISKEILKDINNKKKEKLEMIKKIFSDKKALAQYLKAMNSSIEKVKIEIDESNNMLDLKGKLIPPTSGKIIKSFGNYFDPKSGVELFSPGIMIKAPPFTPVKSIYNGIVEFEGPIEGYDFVVIVKHPGNLASVYGDMDVPLVKKGDIVQQGQIIGVVANYGDNSKLYFEIREKGTPVNPLKWIKNPSSTP